MHTLLTLVLAVALAVPPLHAQQLDTIKPQPLFTEDDALTAGAFLLGALALAPLDEALADEIQDSTLQRNDFLRHGAAGVRELGRPGSLIIGGALYAVGKLTGYRPVADLGLHGTEAIVLGDLVSRVVKWTAGRARPEHDPDNPYSFRLGRGFESRDYQAFPSGHTTSAFAAAAAVTAEASRWRPEARWVVGTVMYGGAALVGVSRMFNNRHWASDVIAGAALGTISGVAVVRYHHSRPNNLLDRVLLGATVAPAPDGRPALVWTVAIP